ncbi:MAG TPA: hypothetical protein VE820_03455, partial [Sphingomicrobium sp.]|nr:hypothetical protein [Sphingomicrobium sp.]
MLQRLMNSVLYAALLLTASAVIVGAYGQTEQPQYPTKTVKLVVTYPPGGTSDLVARPLANALSARLKQNFIVENRAGAGGQI